MIYLREATIEDRDLLYEWANDPETRRASFHTEKITYEEHCRWFDMMILTTFGQDSCNIRTGFLN